MEIDLFDPVEQEFERKALKEKKNTQFKD